MMAIAHNHPDTAQILLKNQAQKDIQEENGLTALIMAQKYNNSDMVKLLES
jgi:ankyrin repeat protein